MEFVVAALAAYGPHALFVAPSLGVLGVALYLAFFLE